MQPRLRLLFVSLLILIGLSVQAWDFPLFWMGYVLADSSPLLGPNHALAKQGKLSTALYAIVGVTGLYISSYPSWGADATPGYIWLVKITPWEYEVSKRWWSTVGALLTIWSLDRLPSVQVILTSGPVHYLGKISFSFYLMHLWIVNTIGLIAFHYAWGLTGSRNEGTNLLGFGLGYGVMWVFIIWISDLFYRCIEVYSVSWGTKLEKLLFVE